MTRRLVIVGGAPATGKTALARALGDALDLPVVSKDDVKEALAEPFATGDRAWSAQLGLATYAALYTLADRMLRSGPGLVLESNFTRELSELRLAPLVALATTAVVLCRIPDALRRRRFEERSRTRHRVHVDSAILADWNEDDARFLIDVGAPRLVVDTSDGYVPPLDAVVAFARGDDRAAVRRWPDDWSERVRGKDCPMCAEGRPEIGHGGARRVFAGRVSDGYLVRGDVGQRGYTVVVWRGRHVADPTELSADEASAYFAEVLRVGRAVERHCAPIKMNFEMLGNSLPHLHTHVVPRYLDDGEPGHPAHFMRADVTGEPPIEERAYTRDADALSELLRSR